MKATVVLAALAASFAGIASAQDLSTIPACVLTCVTQASGTAGCTGLTDTNCICTNAGFQSAQSCLASNCTAAEQQAALTLQNTLCAGTTASGVSSAIDPSIASAAATQTTDISSLTSALSSAGTESVSSAVASATSSATSASSSVASAARSASSSAASAASSAAASASSSAVSKAASASSSAAAATSKAASGASASFDSSSVKIAGLVGLAVMGGMMVMA